MARPSSRQRGRHWETEAADYLRRHGLQILEQGYQCRLGELDLIASADGALIVVEVRARKRTTKGGAAETIDLRKQRKIVLATRHYLMTHPHWSSKPIRFDVVAIDDIDRSEPRIHWIKNAFAAH